MKASNKFMSDLYSLAKQTSQYAINPDDDEEFIIDDRVAVEMAPIPGKDNYIHFVSIRALQPGKKHGSIAMKKVFQLVDDNNIVLVGRIIPYHTQDVTKEELRKWYIKFGAKPHDPANEDGLWFRNPKNSQNKAPLSLDPLTKFKIERGFSNADFTDRVRFLKIISLSALALSVYFIKK